MGRSANDLLPTFQIHPYYMIYQANGMDYGEGILSPTVFIMTPSKLDLWLMSITPSVPPSYPASVYSSSLCSEKTTDEPHFKRLTVPTETDTSDTADSDKSDSESIPYDAEIERIFNAFRQYDRKKLTAPQSNRDQQTSLSALAATTDHSSDNVRIGAINVRGGDNNTNSNSNSKKTTLIARLEEDNESNSDNSQDDDGILLARIGRR
ncbi:hypothetical protein BGX24_004633, partial [Mortierella sp. AD032]